MIDLSYETTAAKKKRIKRGTAADAMKGKR